MRALNRRGWPLMAELRLSINTGFALNRYSEPEEWLRIIGKDCEVRFAQMTADMLNPSLPAALRISEIRKIRKCMKMYDVNINSCFTGAFTRVNHLAHPEIEFQKYWLNWFYDFIDQSVDLGAESIGSHFGIFTTKDNSDKQKREIRRAQNIENWHCISDYAKKKGLKFLTWEPMSISREQGETIAECRRLQLDVNRNSSLPFKLCLDVDHGDLSSPDPRDTDPYAWLEEFAIDAPQIHLKQSSKDKGGHWPFTAKYNSTGKIDPAKVCALLSHLRTEATDLIMEFSFREREPMDSMAIESLQESVQFWRKSIPT